MNLTTDRWIPIVWSDGRPDTVGLHEAFACGEEIRDLAVRPHERIALMRLLICIVQAALDGPVDQDDWKQCEPKIRPAADAYLRKWHVAFELFGDGPRFLQVEGLKKPGNKNSDDQGNSVSKLDLALATGNAPTLFDNGGGLERSFASAQIALMLLTYQCFSPGGTIGVALWKDKPTPGWTSYPKPAPGKSNHAPCLPGNMLHALPRGTSLAETIHVNLLNKDIVDLALGPNKWGQPIWEAMPTSPSDTTKIDNATLSYLGRLMPLSRSIRLGDDCRSQLLANGLNYPTYPGAREASATIVVFAQRTQGPTRGTLGCSLDKAPWRELHSLTVKRIGFDTNGGPLTLQNLSHNQPFDLWVGGLVADQAKPLDTLESTFHLPAAMLSDPSQQTYERGVRFAEHAEFRLRRAVSTYHRELGDNLDRAELRNRRFQIQNKATGQYWTDIEQAVPLLLNIATDPKPLGVNNEWHRTDWGKAVSRAVHEAYEHACPHDTPRKMRAYALGLNTLYFKPNEREEVES